MADIVNAQIIQAVASALLHSLWIGLTITSLLVILINSGLITESRHKYLAHFAGMITLSYLTVIAFILELNTANTTDVPVVQHLHSGMFNADSTGVITSSFPTWQNIVFSFWLIGMFAYGSVQLFNLWRLWSTIRQTGPAPQVWEDRVRTLCSRMGIYSKVRLIASDEVKVPFVFGVLRPLIVFPANYFNQLTPREIEAILLHEIAHISRNDFLLNLIQVALESFLFFNPTTWWLSNEIRKHREYCCDDQVWSRQQGSTYLRALYKAACISTTPFNQSVALFQNKSELMMRVKRMSHKTEPTRSLRAVVIAAIGLIGVFTLFAFQLIDDTGVDRTMIIDAGVDFEIEFEGPELEVFELREVLPIEVYSRRSANVALSDTHPPSKRMLELQAEIERVSREIETISKRMEAEVESTVEAEAHKMEALAEKMEAIAEQREEYYEQEFENSEEMRRIEEITETMEARWEELEDQFEAENEEVLSALEEKIEAKSEQYDTLSAADRQRLDVEMEELTMQLEAEMKQISKAHSEMMNSQEFKQMQEELEGLHEAMSQKQLNLEPMQEDMQKLHDEMMIHQRAIEEKMNGSISDFQREIEAHHQELQKLHKELDTEMKKWHQEHDKD